LEIDLLKALDDILGDRSQDGRIVDQSLLVARIAEGCRIMGTIVRLDGYRKLESVWRCSEELDDP
jgi:hypothetical protein